MFFFSDTKLQLMDRNRLLIFVKELFMQVDCFNTDTGMRWYIGDRIISLVWKL